MALIDTHAHLYAENFTEDIDAVIVRAQAAGVEKIILPNIDTDSIDSLLSLWSSNKSLFEHALGLHPTHVGKNFEEDLEHIHSFFNDDTIAVGEIGIDLYWDQSKLIEQKQAFEIQLKWAKALDLPIIIHARESFSVLFDILQNHPLTTGVFHCFTGNTKEARHIVESTPFYLGIGGVVSFKNSGLAQALMQEVPLNRIVLETDAPYLSPTPFRGKRNESAYLAYIVEHLARCYNVTPEEVAQTTTANALKAFNL